MSRYGKASGVSVAVVLIIAAGLMAFWAACGSSSPGEKSLADREIERLQGEVAANPASDDLKVQLAVAYANAEKYDKSIDLAKEVLANQETHQGALMILGNSYMAQARFRDAIDPYLKVVEINKDNPMKALNKQLQQAQYSLGDIYIRLGQPDKAMEFLKETAQLNPADADSRYLLGKGFAAQGNCEEAIKYFEGAILFVPNFKEPYEGMAECYEKMGNENGVAYAKAMIDYSSGLYPEAAAGLEKVVSADPAFAEALLGLGLTYEKLGRFDAALQSYGAVLNLDAENWLATTRKTYIENNVR